MTQTPPGWYADPAPAAPGAPPLLRWWDGRQWTEHVQPAEPAEPVGEAGRPAPYSGHFASRPGHESGHQPGLQPGLQPRHQPGSPDGGTDPARTPDGVLLAGWWQRVAAYLLDSVLVLAVSAVLGQSFVRRIGAAYGRLLDEVRRAAENGTAAPTSDVLADVSGPLAGFAAVSLLVSLVYNVGFLKALAATPGKLALGLRVRLRERPGPLSWGTVLLRWVAQNAASLLSVVPIVGGLAGVYPLLDSLWPLWDAKKQALHDKAASTNVVRLR